MAIALTTITNAIAGLSISGVTVLDVDQIYGDMSRAGLPVLYPEPVDFVSNFRVSRDSQGGGSTALITIEYDLTYTFLHSPIGAERVLEGYTQMVDKAMEVLDAVLAIDTLTGAVDILPTGIAQIGPVPDPAGNMYHGCRFIFHVVEFGPNG